MSTKGINFCKASVWSEALNPLIHVDGLDLKQPISVLYSIRTYLTYLLTAKFDRNK